MRLGGARLQEDGDVITSGDTVVLAHLGELDDARHYEELSSPFEAARIVLQPLRAERLVPGKVIPPLRLSAARAERCLFVVPTMDGKMAEQCTPGWAGSAPRARCVMERRREILGGDPAFAVGDCLSLIW